MNEHILFVMRSLDNPELFTQAEKEANKNSALTAAADAAVYMADAVYMAYAACADAACADAACDDAACADAERCINKFFERSGEDKQTYIDEVERLKEDKTMNKHILFVMRSLDNPELFTQEEKEANKFSAADAAADYVAYAAAYMAYDAAVAAVYIADAACADAERCINKFFGRSSEDKQTYIDEVERLRG